MMATVIWQIIHSLMSDIKTSGHSKAERGRVRIVEGGGELGG